MCGIIGLIGDLEKKVKENALLKLSHRGPDGKGEWESENGLVWLGHRRLAIIDPEGGVQPLSNESNTIWITFNGCIYNYLELAQNLRQKGHRFKTSSDTEVIIHAYEEWGEACLERFIGMFAFAIWDEKRKRLFCARDRVGEKPFYYFYKEGIFAFASEIKALLALEKDKIEVDQVGLQEYITFQTVLGKRTLYKNIYKLLPGHYLIFEESGPPQIKQYWDIRFDIDNDHTEEYFIQQLRLLLEDAVKIRLRADVPLGAHLSGGLDSSVVACLASTLMNVPGVQLNTFTGGFSEGPAFDETSYARLVANEIGACYHEFRPTAKDFTDTLFAIIRLMDEPAAGPGVFPQFFVSKLASEHVKVILGGQGGDELFIGYARYLIGYLEECLKGSIEETSDRASYAATLGTIIPSLPLLRQYVPMLQQFWSKGLFEDQDRRYYSLMDRSDGSRKIYNPEISSDSGRVFEGFSSVFNASNAKSFLNKMFYFDLKVHLPALLQVEDRTSMAWGLESRLPFLDHRIIDLITKVPPVIKFKNGQPKYLFRKAVKEIVPAPIMNRKDKMGFPVPLDLWYKGDLKLFVRDILLGSRTKERGIFRINEIEKAIDHERSFGRIIWGALCIEIWFRQFIDGKGI